MHPDLFDIGPFTVHSYGTLIVIGFLMGLALIRFRTRYARIPYEKIVDLSFGLLITGFIGAKLFHWLIIPSGLIRDFSLLFENPMEFIKNLGNGFEFFGGIAVGVVFFYRFCRRHALDPLVTLDVITPAIPLAHAFGRLGCFMAGCCYGEQCDLPWAVTFNDPHTLAPRGVALHPTQLY
ncbi:MAG TPA: prolipoprotein diacylglyceryl transferase, partial [bacterium]|nr:prolipoprotein diacylglyceryl transferase [bacterium]